MDSRGNSLCVFSEHVISTAALAYRATGLITRVVFFYQLSRRFFHLFLCLSVSLSPSARLFVRSPRERILVLPYAIAFSRISGFNTLPSTSATRIARLTVRACIPFSFWQKATFSSDETVVRQIYFRPYTFIGHVISCRDGVSIIHAGVTAAINSSIMINIPQSSRGCARANSKLSLLITLLLVMTVGLIDPSCGWPSCDERGNASCVRLPERIARTGELTTISFWHTRET